MTPRQLINSYLHRLKILIFKVSIFDRRKKPSNSKLLLKPASQQVFSSYLGLDANGNTSQFDNSFTEISNGSPWGFYIAIKYSRCIGFCRFRSDPKLGEVGVELKIRPSRENDYLTEEILKTLISIARKRCPDVTVWIDSVDENSQIHYSCSKLNFMPTEFKGNGSDTLFWRWKLQSHH